MFLQLRLFGSGGPVAQTAKIRRELVEDAHWISAAGLNRLLPVMLALPGPEAHELGVHLGMRAGGPLMACSPASASCCRASC